MRLTGFIVGAMLLGPSLAAADAPARPIKASGTAANYDFVATQPDVNDIAYARQVLPAQTPNGSSAVVAQSRVIFLNHLGVTLSPGNNDARTNRSTIVSQQTTFQPWAVSATTWSATVQCMKDMFAPFNATVVDTDPGNVPHIEAVFGGSPAQVGLPSNVGGVSPFTTDCSIIENSIVFTFTDVIPQDARTACEIMAQEVAHSYGLDHELLASDPMTYLQYNGNRSFQNQAVSCGESTTRPCGINGSTCRANQNSVALLTERLGANTGQPGDTIAPMIGITSPSNGATVPPGFQINFTASDNVAVTSADLFVDGTPSGSLTAAPYTFTTAQSLSQGQHTFRIDVTDGTNTQSQEVTVTIRVGAAPPPQGGGSDTGGNGDISGGCQTGSGGSLALALALLGLVAIRRRR